MKFKDYFKAIVMVARSYTMVMDGTISPLELKEDIHEK